MKMLYFWNSLTKLEVARLIIGIRRIIVGVILSTPTITGWMPYSIDLQNINWDLVLVDCIVRLGAVVGIPMIVSGLVLLFKD